MAEPAEQPLLRVVRGGLDDAELAALTAVVAGLAASARASREQKPTVWSDPRGRVRRPIAHGPGAWHASGLPG
ncbi:MAG: acyl-CoA carboxylase subunit epsilon [Labedaea sp.]